MVKHDLGASDSPCYEKGGQQHFLQPKEKLPAAEWSGIRAVDLRLVEKRNYSRENLSFFLGRSSRITQKNLGLQGYPTDRFVTVSNIEKHLRKLVISSKEQGLNSVQQIEHIE